MRRVTVNLAPADLQKEGPAYDLPIVLATLQIPDVDSRSLFLGELSLDGILLMVSVTPDKAITTVFVPAGRSDRHSPGRAARRLRQTGG
jgi:magnesium chelatase family protein